MICNVGNLNVFGVMTVDVGNDLGMINVGVLIGWHGVGLVDHVGKRQYLIEFRP